MAESCITWDAENEWCPKSDEKRWLARYPSKAVPDGWVERKPITAHLDVFVREVPPPIERIFRDEADKWERETVHLSLTARKVLHPSYQAIMSMGPAVVPILLDDLRKTKRGWFWALKHLTQVDPVREEDRGNVDKMIDAWIGWGRKEGKLPSGS